MRVILLASSNFACMKPGRHILDFEARECFVQGCRASSLPIIKLTVRGDINRGMAAKLAAALSGRKFALVRPTMCAFQKYEFTLSRRSCGRFVEIALMRLMSLFDFMLRLLVGLMKSSSAFLLKPRLTFHNWVGRERGVFILF